jgi:hypothetical protein
MALTIPTDKAYVATVNVASELTSGRIIRHGAEMIPNLKELSKASTHARVNVTFNGWDFRRKSVNGAGISK